MNDYVKVFFLLCYIIFSVLPVHNLLMYIELLPALFLSEAKDSSFCMGNSLVLYCE